MPGHKDWIKYTEYHNNTSTMSFDFSSMSNMTKQEAISNNVEKIYSDYAGKDIYLSLSGGMDSEFVAKCLKENNKQFKVVLVDFITNRTELWYAHKWCYENGIVPEVYEIKAYTLFILMKEISEKYNCGFGSARDFMLKDYVENRGGVLLGGGPEPFKRMTSIYDNLNESTSTELEQLTLYPKFCQITRNEHPFKFLMYTPEMVYNMVKEIDYTKPSQLAIAEYYGVLPRPKVHYTELWREFYGDKLIKLNIDMNNKSYYRKLNLGNASDFIAAAEGRQVYTVNN